MKSSLSFLLLGFTSLISVSVTFETAQIAVIDEIWKESSDIRRFGHRNRREIEGSQIEKDLYLTPNNLFCFCGKENWVEKISNINIIHGVICAIEATRNYTIPEKGELNFPSKLGVSKCVYDCIFQRTHLLTSDGKLNKTAVKEVFLDKVFIEEDLKGTAEKVIDRCLNTRSGNSAVSKIFLSIAETTNCKNEAFDFVTCLMTEMVEECPESMKRNDEPKCKEVYGSFKLLRD